MYSKYEKTIRIKRAPMIRIKVETVLKVMNNSKLITEPQVPQGDYISKMMLFAIF